MSCPALSDKLPNGRLPQTIDVYLPGREAWDDHRIELLDRKLTALGYPITTTPQQIDSLDEHEQDLLQRLDLRHRLQAYLDENPETDLEIPPINGVFPLPALPPSSPTTPTAPLNPPSKSLSTSPNPLSISIMTHPPHPPIVPLLKPTAPEFKPSTPAGLLVPLTFSQPVLAPQRPDLASQPASPARLSSTPSLDPVIEHRLDDDLLTDSDQDQHSRQFPSDHRPTQSNAQVRRHEDSDSLDGQEDEGDDIPLSQRLADLNSLRPGMPGSLAGHHVSQESQYDGDLECQSDCTNPSEEEGLGESDGHSAMLSQADMSQLSPLATPLNRLGRSHTFGLNGPRTSLSAGSGLPHNWINGDEEEEIDLVSNPSDEEEAELYQLHRQNIIKSAYAEITNPINQSIGSSSGMKASTPTSRFLLNAAPSPDQATNLAITVGRATGSVMAVGMLDDLQTGPRQGSTSSLNAFAPAFKPSLIFSSPLVANPPGESPRQLPSHQHQDPTPPEIILFERPVSSAPFQVPPSFPTLASLEASDTPTSDSRKSTLQPLEQPGKDNMRTFKFPVTPQSRIVLYQAQMSRSSSPTGAQPGADGVQDGASKPTFYPGLVVDIPDSPALAQIHSGLSLRARSSFDDDSGSDVSPSTSRVLLDQNLDPHSFYELIPTQPPSNSLKAVGDGQEHDDDDDDDDDERDEDDEDEDDEDDDQEEAERSSNSIVSLSQLQEQKRQWRQLSSVDGSHHSGSETHGGHPSQSVPVILDVDSRRKSESEPPKVAVPPGSPFSPFDGMMESSSMCSFREDPPTLRLPPPTSHLILPPPAPRMVALKPSSGNLAQNFKPAERCQSLPPLQDHQDLSVLPPHFDPSPSSPSAPWGGSSEEGNNSKSFTIPTTREISKTDVEDETLFSSRIMEEKEDQESNSSGNSSSSDSSVSLEISHQSGRRQQPELQEFMADLERLLSRKLKGLRQDLGELHSLKVDWDAIKREAIVDEITSVMDNVLRSWSEPLKEKIAASVLPDQKSDRILAAIHQWGGVTEDRLAQAMARLPASSTKDLNSEAIQRIGVQLETLTTQLSSGHRHLDGLDLDAMTAKLSEAVKPQIVQLIDLASDKSETATLISVQLKPHFLHFQAELQTMMARISEGIAERSRLESMASTTTDDERRAGFLKDLAECQQRLLPMIEERVALGVNKTRPESMTEELSAQTREMHADLSAQIDRVSAELEAKLEATVGRRQESETLVDQLRAKTVELESSVSKARAEHGKIRSEKAVDRERHTEEVARLAQDRDRLEASLRLATDRLAATDAQVQSLLQEKDTLALDVGQMSRQIEALNDSLNGYKSLESQWQRETATQHARIAALEREKEEHEMQMAKVKTIAEAREAQQDAELARVLDRDQYQTNQIRQLFDTQISLVKDFHSELQLVERAKAEGDGEIRTLRKRISDQDEQIGNLHQSSASKQQALAMANQKLSELERRGKQESDGHRAEVEVLQAELSRARSELEGEQQRRMGEEEERAAAVAGLRAELEAAAAAHAGASQRLAGELEQANARALQLAGELESATARSGALAAQLDDARRADAPLRPAVPLAASIHAPRRPPSRAPSIATVRSFQCPPPRLPSPAPSRFSQANTFVSVDQDGWWSSHD